MTTTPTDADLRAEIVRLGPWHYDIEIAPGVRTGAPVPPGTYRPELGKPSVIKPDFLVKLLAAVYPGGLAGRSILDCACNAGGYLFDAARHGAGRSFGFDVREHWIQQARFLARHLPSENIQFAVRDLMSLPVQEMLAWCGFPHSRVIFNVAQPYKRRRIAIMAARDERTFAHCDTIHRPPLRRGPWKQRFLRLLGR